jgi:hypothetical protein
MEHANSTTSTTFDNLFNQLLSTLAEEQDIKTNSGPVTAIIEVRNRLQALRSDLAAVRNRLVTEATTRLRNDQPPRYAI